MAQKRVISNDLTQDLRAEALRVGLRDRQIRPSKGPWADAVHLVLLAEGELHLETASLSRGFEGLSGLVLPSDPQAVLTLSAGASGWLIGLSPAMLGELTVGRPELEMMLPLSKSVILAPGLQDSGALDVDILAEALMDEIARQRPGHRTAILAWLRLIILGIWRAAYHEEPMVKFQSETHILESFRHEVEIHFRSHLTIADYARNLGLSESRLRRICQRHLGRSPIQLVHQRLMREAVTWLGHSGRKVAEIAQALGFADTAEFSHFFKRLSDISPTAYREAMRSSSEAAESERNRFADWP